MYVLRLQLKEIQDGSLLHLRDLSPTGLSKEEIKVHDIREWKRVCTTYLSPFKLMNLHGKIHPESGTLMVPSNHVWM
jgi:hypothetical protein